MRTTLTIDDDVADELKVLQHRSQLSFKETLNVVLRRGLRALDPPTQVPPFVVETFDGGFAPGVDTMKLNQLLDELEAEDFLTESGK